MRRAVVVAQCALVGALSTLAACAAPEAPAPAPAELQLAGVVRDALSGEVIAGAELRAEGLERVARSDTNGAFTLTVPSADVELAVLADAHIPGTVRADASSDVRLWPLVAPDAAADAWLRARQAERDVLHDSPDDADLRPEARALLVSHADLPLGPSTAPTTTTGDVGATRAALGAAPATIRVWRRGVDGSTASCSGRVDVISFEEYVKGVVPHEWIASWPDESLRAGAMAARTYAWYWVAAGGKYTCADVDDTTACQVYRDDRSARASADVDATAGRAITRSGAVVFAQYSAENGDPTADSVSDSVCAGHAVAGHGHGMCQWGTSRWASSHDYAWMVLHYYPGAAVEGGAPPAPAYDATYVGQSTPTEMTSGDRVVAWIDFRNDGTSTWSLSSTFVGTTMPHDHASPFYDAVNWVNDHRASAPDHSGYGPGATGRFSFMLAAPEVTTDTVITDHFGLVEEGITWFGPNDVTITVAVHPRASAPPPPPPPPADAGTAAPAGCTPTAELCGDGVDQDCDGADLPCAAHLPDGAVVPAPGPTPDGGVGGSDAGSRGGRGYTPPHHGCSVAPGTSSAGWLLLAMGAPLALAARRRPRRRS